LILSVSREQDSAASVDLVLHSKVFDKQLQNYKTFRKEGNQTQTESRESILQDVTSCLNELRSLQPFNGATRLQSRTVAFGAHSSSFTSASLRRTSVTSTAGSRGNGSFSLLGNNRPPSAFWENFSQSSRSCCCCCDPVVELDALFSASSGFSSMLILDSCKKCLSREAGQPRLLSEAGPSLVSKRVEVV